MTEPIVASTQYGDFKGTVSIDQADGQELLHLLAAKVNVPKGYTPVGFSINITAGGGRPGHRYSLTVFAIDTEILTEEGWRKYALNRDNIAVFEFQETIAPTDLADLLIQGIKRFEMVTATKLIKGKPMKLLDDN